MPARDAVEKKRRRAQRTTFAVLAPPQSLAPVGSVRDFGGAFTPILAVPDASFLILTPPIPPRPLRHLLP
jgi:hypothetical protein